MPLDKYIENPIIIPKGIADIPKNQNIVMLNGAEWCPHCKSTIKVMNSECKKLNNTTCIVNDHESKIGREITRQMGLQVQAYPTIAACNHNKESGKTLCNVSVGSMNASAFRKNLVDNNLD